MFGILIGVLGFQVNDGIFLGLGFQSDLVCLAFGHVVDVVCVVLCSSVCMLCFLGVSLYCTVFEICVQNMLVVVCYFLFTFLFSLP